MPIKKLKPYINKPYVRVVSINNSLRAYPSKRKRDYAGTLGQTYQVELSGDIARKCILKGALDHLGNKLVFHYDDLELIDSEKAAPKGGVFNIDNIYQTN
jgi:hypothetical protein